MKNIFEKVDGFNWDDGNINKNKKKHQVEKVECEEVFFNQPLVIFPDKKHSQEESRYYILGKTTRNRKLLVVFTIRNNKIRVVSARDMSRKERKTYEEA
ncbi:MAG: hypothetical protein ACD_7C00166G0003 [uncultured bacterium]|nr:MAG: hypothetical protein ACD_7C00166G0003 [uncultured bacterium]KKP68740.1 MAG: hypothetical protein UR66_C0003G0005 [Candidatus Moranbacteria bacterium GW2011_GWE1_35_17]KKP82931.1 MAG: hypothetical protein UR82_C0027G0005 [Candidatus Moranbacteria bacterium GW2011_GWF1_35_5]KKP83300.1 MAG: hypothetical protein UR83_C0037G0005 [Candidatus Moranbacteria bacterium GW2011_GWF2_35_54]HBR79813.1 hypothetical protein [Candidatus Moranbacteria bacterium]